MASPTTPAPNGIVLIDKPQGFTSHDAVARMRRLAGTRKVGHAGTLDPMATGLLILGLGSSTRLLTFIVGLSKEYLATIRLGSSSTTDDAQGDLLGFAPQSQLDRVTDELIAEGIIPLTGEIEQVPSTFSAIKVDGKRAYALAREGESVELKARAVTIHAFEILGISRGVDEAGNGFIDVDVRVECSSGTYIRALARDLGFKLGVGGHLTALRRTRIGSFHVSDAHDLDKLEHAPELLTPADVARGIFPVVDLNQTQALELSQGKKVFLEGFPDSAEPVAAIGPEDRLVGLITVKKNQSRVVVNFPTETEKS
ncbi:tRNA pseudouridine(55) synthase TruB [Aurantimicrobium minutum]|uniref:tRNA pseudouridine(55) synthase TruB n=1 Tax=Aurantimicrobium minutum TaxID=708131 RepID=UPI0024738A98|nr:tRNA pseudouridine(55) synthase TruB [Aurantimicrobium minutum]MDH6422887.1 tRNA pseudouridine55 synthase [Aurantimicrobium minutum]